MPRKVVTSNCEFAPWLVESGLNINPIPPDTFYPEVTNDALEVYMAGPKNCGALVTYKPPIYSELPYVGLDLKVYFNETAAARCRCNELDVKGAYKGRIYDWSSQWNYSKGGMLQMDPKTYTWTDSGFVGGLPVVGWNQYSFRYFKNTAKATYSYLSTSINGGQPFIPPAAFQDVPTFADKWDDCLAIQLQIVNGDNPGAFMVRYKDITLTQSDSAF